MRAKQVKPHSPAKAYPAKIAQPIISAVIVKGSLKDRPALEGAKVGTRLGAELGTPVGTDVGKGEWAMYNSYVVPSTAEPVVGSTYRKPL